MRLRAVFIENDDFAVFDVAYVLCTDNVECTGLGGQDRATVEFSDDERTNAERIAGADQFLVGEADKGIGAFELAQSFDETVDEAIAFGTRDQMQNHLGVGGRLHHGAFVHKVAPQLDAVGEIAIVADCKTAAFELREEGLHVAQDGFAGS